MSKEPSNTYVPYIRLEDFVPESRSVLQDYICNVCSGVMNDPVMDGCGMIYCRKCITAFFSDHGMCPRRTTKCSLDTLISVPFVEKVTGKQLVYCKNKNSGCEWVDIFSDLNSHLTTKCKHQPIRCQFEGCDVEMDKTSIELHQSKCEYRKEMCQYCGEEGTFRKMDVHYEVCPKMKINCRLNCGEFIERENQEAHISKDCSSANVDCPYKRLGCHFNGFRKEIKEHLRVETDNHNFLIFDQLSELKNRFEKFADGYEEKFNRIISQVDSKEFNVVSLKSKGEKKEERSKKRSRHDDTLFEDYPQRSEDQDSLSGFSSGPKKKQNADRENLTYFLSKDYDRQEEITFDTVDISKGISVNVNTAICSPNVGKTEHRFAMVSNLINETNCEWKVKIQKLNGKWLGIGVCLKELVISNKFKFVNNRQNFMHGTFMISTNGYSWNSFYDEENNILLKNFPQIISGDEIGFFYSSESEILEVTVGERKYHLNHVKSPRGNSLVPCVVFLTPKDEVAFSKLLKF